MGRELFAANEAVAETASTADTPYTANEDVATLTSTVAKAVATFASTADEDVGPRFGETAEWRMLAF